MQVLISILFLDSQACSERRQQGRSIITPSFAKSESFGIDLQMIIFVKFSLYAIAQVLNSPS